MVNLFGRPPENFDELLARLEAEAGITTPEPAAAGGGANVNGSSAAGHEYQKPGSSGSSAFDRLAELTSWADILEPMDWRKVNPQDSAAEEGWQRPGATSPVSAKVPKANPAVLVVWSTDAGLPDGPDQKNTKARVLAHLHYRGDESALAKDLVRGQARGVPAHVNDAFRAERREPVAVPPTTVLEAGDGAEGNSGGRWVDLNQFLDGTYSPPEPSIGATRDDGIPLLYPGMWHTLIALTAAGKTTFALWQVKAVLEWGGHVVYIHFEEVNPNGIIHRLRGLGVSAEAIRKRFHWGHVDTPWKWGEMAFEIEQLEIPPQLAVLDGINAACGMHGWAVKEPESVGLYRAMFVHPLTKTGAAALSLGHPPKAPNRQSESYGYGAAGWLNDVDGVGYRMTASKTPIGKNRKGSSALHSVKDRYGEVERWGELQADDGMPWFYLGQFIVDDTLPEDTLGSLPKTAIHLSVPAKNEEGDGKDSIDHLCDHILSHLRETTGRFSTKNNLEDALRSKEVHVNRSDLAPALLRLVSRGLLEWPEVEKGARPGWLTTEAIEPGAGEVV
jgi:hypothetical protein